MRFPGTLSISDVTFIQLLQQTGQSLRHAGFTRIVFIGDHGGYQRDLTVAATALNQQWKGSSARAIGLLKYYQLADQDYTATLRADGYADNEIGTHAALADTSLELATAPQMVRSDRLADPASATAANGVYGGSPARATAAEGQKGVDLIVAGTVTAIRTFVDKPLEMRFFASVSVVALAAIGTAGQAEAPDTDTCLGLTRYYQAQDNYRVALDESNPNIIPAPVSSTPAVTGPGPQFPVPDTGADGKPINIYAETTPDKLSPATSSALTRVYVPNHSSNTVSVIDPTAMKVVDTFKVGRGPQHVVPSFDMKTLWVNNTADLTKNGSVTPIDPATGKPGTAIPVNDPYNMYFTPDGKQAIVVAEAYRRLELRDAQTMALVSTIETPMCAGLNHADYSWDYSFLVVTCEFGGVYSGKHGQTPKEKDAGPSLIKVDLKAGQVTGVLTFSKPGMPQDVRLSPDGKTFYVTDMINDGVFLVDAATFTEKSFMFTGKGAHGLNVSRDGKYLYVANRGSNRMPDRAGGPGSVSVINFATNAVEHTWLIPGGGSPDMGNVSADGKQLWLSGRYDGQVYCIDTEQRHGDQDQCRHRAAWADAVAAAGALLPRAYGEYEVA